MFIKELYENDIWLTPSENIDWSVAPTRIVVRWVITNSEWKIAIIHHEKEWWYSLPWWAVEGQSLTDAFQREAVEEVWMEITDIVPTWITREYKIYDGKPVINHTTFFSARATWEQKVIDLSDAEIATGDSPIWISFDDAKTAMRKTLLESPSYWATFELQRDLFVLEQWNTDTWASSKLKDAEEIAKKAQYDYIMLKSEFDSYIRRMESDSKEWKINQLVELSKKLLPIIDQLGQSVSHIPVDLEDNTWAAWVKLTYENAGKTLSGLWISQIPTIWHEPDMELHDPLSVEPTDDESLKGKIIREFQPWYVYEKDWVKKVITAAKVIVGQ